MAAAAVILLALPNCRRRLWLNVPECLERALSECEVTQSAYSAGSNPEIRRFAAGIRSRFRDYAMESIAGGSVTRPRMRAMYVKPETKSPTNHA